MRRSYWFIVLMVSVAASGLRGSEPSWSELAEPVVEDGWVRPPAGEVATKPVWGLADGLRIGLAPLPGPRGLLRVYAPYVGQPSWRTINFIAIEPIIVGRTGRSFSELELSSLALGTGKVMWSVDRPDDWSPRKPVHPARGVIGEENGVKTLTVYIGVEKFRNGAAVFLRLTFRADRPHEAQIATFAQPTSVPMAYCVATATMGNYARLRRLHLADGMVTAQELYANATFAPNGFTPHARFGLERLVRGPNGAAILAATTDERDPAAVLQTPASRGWQYFGRPATQYWRCDHPHPKLMAQVNARQKYWASENPIPGGTSFENLELIAPFESGQTWTFGVTTDPPDTLQNPSGEMKRLR
ncbi:MAG: hypothetical protein IT425_01260 [Pirellulales bacterium]|nr:hypothetical protein [Pirellulales bacterium]